MRYRSKAAALVAAVAVAGCGDSGTNPGGGTGGDDAAARFEQLADSVDGEGWSPTAEALRHAAKIVRLAGGATPVTLTIDGEVRRFDAVAEQLDFPNIVCNWPDSTVVPPDSGGVPPPDTVVVPPPDTVVVPPPPDTTVVPGDSVGGPEPEPTPSGGGGGCEQVGTWSMRTLIAWEPEKMSEVVRIVTDLGQTEVEPGVPDVMTGLPTGSASDGASDPPPAVPDSAVGEFPGFLGEYLVDEAGVSYAVEGTQSNDLVGSAGECTERTVTLDWARFECSAAQYRFEFDMRTEMARIDPLPSPTPSGDSHELAMSATTIDGVRLEVIEWVPPAPPPIPVDPPPGPPPDSTGVPPGPPPPAPPPVDSTGVSPEG
jgi:hypothetical protein